MTYFNNFEIWTTTLVFNIASLRRKLTDKILFEDTKVSFALIERSEDRVVLIEARILQAFVDRRRSLKNRRLFKKALLLSALA